MSSDRRKQSLEGAIRYFAKCNSKVVTKGNIKLQLSLETVKNEAEQSGLEPEHFTTLVDAAGSGYFTQNVSRQLIRCLIPKTKVPQEAVIKAVSWMSTNKPAVAIQAMLIRWILVVYDYIDGYDKLHCLYGILFLFLDSQVMLPHVCHLLFLLTRKEDVKLFRVHKLLSLIKGRVGPQSCLFGLLTIYKLYYPNLVSFALPTSNKTFFGSYDRKWKSQVREMVERSVAAGQGSGLTHSLSADATQLTASRSKQLTNQRPPRKKRRLDIPISHSSSADTTKQEKTDVYSLSTDTNKVPFVRIDTFVNLLQHVEKIEFPSQIAACLRDPLLQHVMAYAADRVVTARFTFWLQHALNEEFLNHAPKTTEENENLLQLLVNLTDFLQEGIPVVDNFLAAFLHTWNGANYRPYIFRLLTHCQVYPFNELNDLILEPLRQLYCSSSVYFKCQCLLTLTELLRNYIVYECPRLQALNGQTTTTLDGDPSVTRSGTLRTVKLGAPPVSGTTGAIKLAVRCALFPERLSGAVQVGAVIHSLASFIDTLAVVGLQLEGDNPLLLHVIVSYIQLLSNLTGHPGVERIILPSTTLVRFVLFSSSAAAISVMSAAFCRYKESFTRVTVRRRETVSTFNDMLVDICDALWRNKVFSNPLQGSLKALSAALSPILARLALTYPSSRFSIFQGQAFLSYAWRFLLMTQPQGKKVHPNQLKMVKDTYLQFLRQEHLEGIVCFISTFIMRKSLSQSDLVSSQSLSVVTSAPAGQSVAAAASAETVLL